MASKRKKPGGAIGKGGIDPAPRAQDLTVRVAAEQLLLVSIDDLVPYANNARTHSKAQIAQLRSSLREFGFVTPVLIDWDNNIIAGHGRVEAARAEGMTEVPCVMVTDLTEAQRKAYILADNRLSETAGWDEPTLRMELESLAAVSFDTAVIGFDAAAPLSFRIAAPVGGDGPSKTVPVSGHTRAAPGQGEAVSQQDDGPEETEEYRRFVEKFKPKLTTDDCYTPENVYEAVRDWAVRRYSLEGREVVRPFWPGGDYQGMTYPNGCVVIDNPPFSILSEICRFYMERGIRFFLFAPTLTLFSVAAGTCDYLPCGVTVTYANGANVSTSFVSDLGGAKIEVSPELYQAVKAANDENVRSDAAELPVYAYPPEVVSGGKLWSLAKYGQSLQIGPEDTAFIRSLDSQKAAGKAIYGGGFLISERAAAKVAAAEVAAAERAAAECTAAVRWALSERERALSERERAVVKALGEGRDRDAGTETADGPDQSQGEETSEQGRGGGAAEPGGQGGQA